MARIILTRTSVTRHVTARVTPEDFTTRVEAFMTLQSVVEAVTAPDASPGYKLVKRTDSGFLVDTGTDTVIFSTFVTDF